MTATTPQSEPLRSYPALDDRKSVRRVGTRGSPLAILQTRRFLQSLATLCPVSGETAFEEYPILTTGDLTLERRLADVGGKGMFAKEIHEALLERRIDLAVHSLKDLETELPPGVVLACTMQREDARDALVLSPGHNSIDPQNPLNCLPHRALIGTSSIRRQAQLLHARPDLRVVGVRGNIQTRLAKLAGGDCTALLLALAGLRRLGMTDIPTVPLDPNIMVPAAGQGIVGITVREVDFRMREILSAIEDPEAKAISTAERSLLAHLDGSCRTPIGGHARLLKCGDLSLTGLIARSDGSFLIRATVVGAASDASRIGLEVGSRLRADSPRDLFA